MLLTFFAGRSTLKKVSLCVTAVVEYILFILVFQTCCLMRMKCKYPRAGRISRFSEIVRSKVRLMKEKATARVPEGVLGADIMEEKQTTERICYLLNVLEGNEKEEEECQKKLSSLQKERRMSMCQCP